MGKPAANGELRQRKKGKSEDDGADDDLLEDHKKGVLDHFIMLRALVSIFNLVVTLMPSTEKKAAGDEAPTSGKGDAAKKKAAEKDEPKMDYSDKEQLKAAAREQLKKNFIPIFLMVVGFLTCLLIIGGEGHGESERLDRNKIAEDYYSTLGVARDAEGTEVKRAYKTLAKRWHPDKNPNCTTCQETFGKIAVAYETLFDGKKRAAYDESGGIATAELKSARSVPLTAENFDQMVTYSNDVWIVEIFKPDDGSCAQFHPFWEAQIQKYGHLVRFGRVDVSTDLGKWLPVKYRVLPTILKFGRHLGSPEIFPITAMHETPQMLMKFVLTSFPNIGLPLHLDAYALSRWMHGAGRRHKVLLAIPGKSEEERYKSHLIARKLASRWSELFEFRTAETGTLHKLAGDNMPAEFKDMLPPANEAGSKAGIYFLSADGAVKPKAHAILEWPATEDDIVMQLLSFAQMAAPALSTRIADLLCRSPADKRVYCLVLLDPPDTAVKRAMEELAESQTQHIKEVAEIRENGEATNMEEEDNFIVPAVRLFRRGRGWLSPSTGTCRAPKFGQVETALGGANAMLLDLDTGRIAALKGLTSFRGVYPQIAYEESLAWVDEALHPFLSLPDCDEGMSQHFARSVRQSSLLELLMKIVTLFLLLEALAKTATERSVKWGVGAGILLLITLMRSPPFLRSFSAYLPGSLFAPMLLNA